MVGRMGRTGTVCWFSSRAAMLALALSLAGCMGLSSEDGGISAEQIASATVPQGKIDPNEVAIAEREHPKIVAAFGGKQQYIQAAQMLEDELYIA